MGQAKFGVAVANWRNMLPSQHDFREGSGSRNMSERIVCVLNPRAQAGRAGARVDELRRAVDAAFAQGSVVVSEGPGHATELAAQAIEAGADIVAAVGGDGTCNEVVNGFFDGERPRRRTAIFAVIPWGTGSDLPRSVLAPRDLTEALWVAATGMTLPTDVGACFYTGLEGGEGLRMFINVAGFGANGDVVHRANTASKRLGGRATFVQATLGTLLNFQAPPVAVEWEGPDGAGHWDAPLLSAFIANGAYCGGGMHVGRHGSMHDGLLDLTLVPNKGRARNIAESWRLYDGSLDRVGGSRIARVDAVRATPIGAEPVLLDVDGEQPGRLPARFKVMPGAIFVRGGWLRSPMREGAPEIWHPRG